MPRACPAGENPTTTRQSEKVPQEASEGLEPNKKQMKGEERASQGDGTVSKQALWWEGA